MRVRAVLFDLGGTLVDEKDFEGWVEILRRLSLEVDPDLLRHAYLEVQEEMDATPPSSAGDERLADFWQRTLSRAAEKPVERTTVLRLNAAVRETERPVHLYSDTRRCLDILRGERRALGVVSNSTSEATCRRILDRAGILDYFARVVSSGTEGVEKPDAEIFRRAVQRMKVRPQEALFVGNLARTDAKAAEAAGLHGLWLNREGFGYGTDPPEITSLLEVPLFVHRLEGRTGPTDRRAADGAR